MFFSRRCGGVSLEMDRTEVVCRSCLNMSIRVWRACLSVFVFQSRICRAHPCPHHPTHMSAATHTGSGANTHTHTTPHHTKHHRPTHRACLSCKCRCMSIRVYFSCQFVSIRVYFRNTFSACPFVSIVFIFSLDRRVYSCLSMSIRVYSYF